MPSTTVARVRLSRLKVRRYDAGIYGWKSGPQLTVIEDLGANPEFAQHPCVYVGRFEFITADPKNSMPVVSGDRV